MGKIFVVMGKSASGKDSIYKELVTDGELLLKQGVIYTTRPMRTNETDGREYHFTDNAGYEKLVNEGKIIESRTYNTVYGPWHYFTVDDGQFDEGNVIMIGTLEAYVKIKNYFGGDRVCPVYVDVNDYVRLKRALEREHQQEHPGYEEMCRRFIADCRDFSMENIKAAGIEVTFENDAFDDCVKDIKKYIFDNINEAL